MSNKWYEGYTDDTADRTRARAPSRVLLADDDPDLRMLLSAALTKDGYQVIEALDGVDLLDKLQDALSIPISMPDVIVMDVIMPGYSGLGVLTALRRANWFTPVIVISAINDASIRQRAKDLGATAFFKKPFDVDDLRTAVINASLTSQRAKAID
jgi:two-component system, response regulator, stage 0 sporulation protein F